jgi:hypothetical protein
MIHFQGRTVLDRTLSISSMVVQETPLRFARQIKISLSRSGSVPRITTDANYLQTFFASEVTLRDGGGYVIPGGMCHFGSDQVRFPAPQVGMLVVVISLTDSIVRRANDILCKLRPFCF